MKSTESSVPGGERHTCLFREQLQAELLRRCTTNPQYSLRAFALDLEIDHASLSQLLRGRRAMTVAMIERLGPLAGISPAEIEAFVRAERTSTARFADETSIRELQTLSQYAAAIVTEWEHLAILELTHVQGFVPDTNWIARVLGLSPDSVTLAVNRLLYMGLLVMEDERTWRDLSGPTVLRAGASDATEFGRAAVRALVERMHALSPPPASDELPQEHCATTLAVNTRHLPEALERLRIARDEIASILESDSARDEVYRLETRLYPLTHVSR